MSVSIGLFGFQLSGRTQKYAGKANLHIITVPGGLLEHIFNFFSKINAALNAFVATKLVKLPIYKLKALLDSFQCLSSGLHIVQTTNTMPLSSVLFSERGKHRGVWAQHGRPGEANCLP